MKRAAFLVFLGITLLIAAEGAYTYFRTTQPPIEHLWNVPPFEMTAVTSAGISSPLNAKDLLGHPWIADFIYTRCAGPCPLLSAKMAELQKVLPADVRLVSFTVDPHNDTPEVLQAYAAQFNADPRRWLFVQGSDEELYNLAFKGFRVALSKDPSAPRGYEVTHSTKFALVDQQGVIRRFYDVSSETLTQDIKRDVAALLRESR